jgi:predicted XRE-type DNA-binding protein
MEEESRVELEESCGNVFADLGLPDAEELYLKANLVIAISQAMKAKRVSQKKLATMVGLDQPKVSALLRGQTRGYSADRLISILNALGQDVKITIEPIPVRESRAGYTLVERTDPQSSSPRED